MKLSAHQEDPPAYNAGGDDAVVAHALRILEQRVNRSQMMDTPQAVKEYLCVRAAGLEHEQFCALWLDTHHRVLHFDVLFRGTQAQTSIYPREVLKRALQLNAAAVIFSHNHPSGYPEPSRSDEMLTQTLKSALHMIDVRVLDHIVTGGHLSVSFAERGLL